MLRHLVKKRKNSDRSTNLLYDDEPLDKAIQTYQANTDFLNTLLSEVHPHNHWDESGGLHC